MQKMDFEPLHALPGPVGCASPGARAHSGRPGLETLGEDAGGRPGRRGPVGRLSGRWAQRAAEAPAKANERTRASRARQPRPFTNRSEISPTARPGVGGHEGLPGMPSGRSWPARARKISKKPLTGALWRAGTVNCAQQTDTCMIFSVRMQSFCLCCSFRLALANPVLSLAERWPWARPQA